MSYTPTTWAAGDTVTAAKLNKLEQGVASGGGALKVVVTATESEDKTIYTLDKTWKQISDAIENGTIPYMINHENGFVNYLTSIRTYEQDSGMGYVVEFDHEYQTDSENGYPTYEQGRWN